MSVINTNISATIAQNSLVKTNREMQTAMQQLSTGSRINSAKDDAAGLAISSKMTSQINGLNQAVRNANDGISLVQTAEGALVEVTNMMQRMRELAVQSANDTNTAADREALNLEFQELKEEINRIGNNTQFNGTNILDRSFSDGTGTFVFQVGANAAQTIEIDIIDFRTENASTGTAAVNTTTSAAAAISASGDAVAQVNAVAEVRELRLSGTYAEGDTISLTVGEGGDTQSFQYTVSAADVGGADDAANHVLIAASIQAAATGLGVTVAVDADNSDTLTFSNAEGPFTLTFATSGSGGGTTAISTVGTAAVAAVPETQAAVAAVAQVTEVTLAGTYAEGDKIEITAGDNTLSYTVTSANASAANQAESIAASIRGLAGAATTLGVSAVGGATDTIELTGAAGTAFTVTAGVSGQGALGAINSSTITTQANSDAAVTALDSALTVVNEERAKMGATINRLNFAADNLMNVSQNASESRSRILDTDFAATTTELARTQIIAQAGTAMLAQANQQPQSVLALLQ